MNANEAFSIWLKKTCFQEPTQEAYDLARMAWEAATRQGQEKTEPAETGRYKLSCWFGLTYASWLTIPRVMLENMPDSWQSKLSDLLEEYDLTFTNQPDIGTRVQITKDGKLTKTPPWLLNYRRPDYKMLQAMKQVVHKEPTP